MATEEQQMTHTILIPPNYVLSTPSEKFDDSSRGNCSWHTLISQPLMSSSDRSVGIAVCSPGGGHLCKHRHTQAEVYHILEGQGDVFIDDVTYKVEAESTPFIPGDAEHGVANTGDKDLRWLHVSPTGAFGDVIYRFSSGETRKGIA